MTNEKINGEDKRKILGFQCFLSTSLPPTTVMLIPHPLHRKDPAPSIPLGLPSDKDPLGPWGLEQRAGAQN